MNLPSLTVVLCAHNPDRARLQRTLEGLRAQTLQFDRWEILLIDNASAPSLSLEDCSDLHPKNCRLLSEPQAGLTFARRRGVQSASGEWVVFVDADNVLAPDYLEQTIAAFVRLPRVGAIGGKSLPEFSSILDSNDWRREFFPLLGLRDLGDTEQISAGLRPAGAPRDHYPDFAPIGAGMAFRRAALQGWLENFPGRFSDRRGSELTSAGDNAMIFAAMRAGWEVAYVPALTLTHLIPDSRLSAEYLARLNHGIQKSWTQLLLAYDASPWEPIPRWTVPLRQLKAWLVLRGWRDLASRVRWAGVRGHFEGRVRPALT